MEACISVVIPVYNGEKTISHALDSVLIQEHVKNILIIDDASSDRTEDIVCRYQKDYANIFYYKNEQNMGAAASRNKGVHLADGEYIAFLDADDYWSEGKLKEQLRRMKETGAVLCSTGRELLKPDGTPTGHVLPIKDKITYKELLKHNSLSCSAVLAKRKVLMEFPMEHEDSHEDYITWLRIVQKYGFATGVNKPYLKYRLSNTSKSGTKLKSAKMTFMAYRYLGLSYPKSILCFISYTLNGIYKYYLNKGKKNS